LLPAVPRILLLPMLGPAMIAGVISGIVGAVLMIAQGLIINDLQDIRARLARLETIAMGGPG
jgi:hypothetical protein